jgi:MoaD family protein
MVVTVSIPTILRTHTGGEKTVEASGSTVAEVIDNLDSNHGGIKARLVKEGTLHRFVNVYVNDEDVRFAGGLEAAVSDGDNVTILPAVAGG